MLEAVRRHRRRSRSVVLSAALAGMTLLAATGCSTTANVARNTTFAPPSVITPSPEGELTFPPAGRRELLRVTYRSLPPSSPLTRTARMPAGGRRYAVFAACQASNPHQRLSYTIMTDRGGQRVGQSVALRCDGKSRQFESAEVLPPRTAITVALTGDLEGVTGAFVVLSRAY